MIARNNASLYESQVVPIVRNPLPRSDAETTNRLNQQEQTQRTKAIIDAISDARGRRLCVPSDRC